MRQYCLKQSVMLVGLVSVDVFGDTAEFWGLVESGGRVPEESPLCVCAEDDEGPTLLLVLLVDVAEKNKGARDARTAEPPPWPARSIVIR